MRFKVFISSVQREFAAERQMLAEYVRKDALLGKFFDVFLFEEEPACDVEARDLYLPERSPIFISVFSERNSAMPMRMVSRRRNASTTWRRSRARNGLSL